MSSDNAKLLLIQKHPEPPIEHIKPLVNLSELKPRTYVNTIVRVAFIKSREKEDELGGRPYIFGVAEDSTFKAPFICYKPYQMFFKNSVFKFENAYIHELMDHSLLIILSEYSSIRYLPEEPADEYFWQPKIGSIHRPMGICRVTLEGVVSKIYSSSGLVKRCDGCGRVIYSDLCKCCGEGKWHWEVRISCRLSDKTGSIETVFPQYLTCKILGRPISEILCVANVLDKAVGEDFSTITYKVKPFEKMAIMEATVIDASSYRQCGKPIVPDNKYPKIYYPKNVNLTSKHVLDAKERVLNYSNEEDREVFAKILEKALDLEVRRRTNLPKVHGIYLTEEPAALYWTERAKLYLGFELYISPLPEHIQIEFYPSSLVRESVLDYVKWRRERGASAESVKRALLKRRNVILAPNGTIGMIEKVLFEEAGNFHVPTLNVSLPEFWRTVYDVHVDRDEKPLLVVKPYNLEVELTYPPSCVYFDEQTLYLKSSAVNFLKNKRLKLRHEVLKLASEIMGELGIDSWKVLKAGSAGLQTDAQRLILHDIREKLLGRTVKSTGSIVQVNGKLYFIPKALEGIY
ncbi:MAG: hypothetical protein FGF50_11505 [Candidatus Brockarchaeota archaeon]|nr:hypothetical protein [Candidatus Brockarchaeota archaeon]